MPRRSGGRSGGGLFGRGRSSSKGAAPKAAPAPARVQSAPAPAPVAPQSGGMMGGGLGSTIMQGLAFGTGSAVAHRAVDAVAGPRTVQHEWAESPAAAPAAASAAAPVAAAAAGPCVAQQNQFDMCMRENNGNVAACQFYFDLLGQCQRN